MPMIIMKKENVELRTVNWILSSINNRGREKRLDTSSVLFKIVLSVSNLPVWTI